MERNGTLLEIIFCEILNSKVHCIVDSVYLVVVSVFAILGMFWHRLNYSIDASVER